jgi:hypothetical protein
MPYKDRQKSLDARKRYKKTDKGKATNKKSCEKYFKTEKGQEVKKEGQKRYSKTEKGKACKKRWNTSEKGKLWNENRRLKDKYGITLIEKETMFNEQKCLCKLCNRELPNFRESCVEHDHKTGRIRGLVHNSCNIFIGIVEQTPEVLLNINQYLTDCKEDEERSAIN